MGLAFGLWGMQILSALCLHSFFRYSAGTGVLARAALIAAICTLSFSHFNRLYRVLTFSIADRKAMVLSGKARTVITNGRLVNHIGTDVSRIDFCAGLCVAFSSLKAFERTLTWLLLLLLSSLSASTCRGPLPSRSSSFSSSSSSRSDRLVSSESPVRCCPLLLFLRQRY